MGSFVYGCPGCHNCVSRQCLKGVPATQCGGREKQQVLESWSLDEARSRAVTAWTIPQVWCPQRSQGNADKWEKAKARQATVQFYHKADHPQLKKYWGYGSYQRTNVYWQQAVWEWYFNHIDGCMDVLGGWHKRVDLLCKVNSYQPS